MGDGAVELAVHVEVGIHQIELHAAHIHTPDVRVDDTAGIRHLKNHGAAILVHHLLDGELVEVLGLVVGNLLTVNAESLSEISVAVKETDSGHVNAAVRCLFDIVTGEYAKTAGIDFETVAQAVFHREIRNRRNIFAHWFGHVSLKIGIYMVDLGHENLIGKNFGYTLRRKLLKEHYRVFACFAPEVGVEGAEEGFGFAVPYPP